MTRILIPRGTSGSSSNSPNQGHSGSLSARPEPVSPSSEKDDECAEELVEQVVVGDELLEYAGSSGSGKAKSDEALMEVLGVEQIGDTPSADEVVKKDVVGSPQELVRGFNGERPVFKNEGSSGDSSVGAGSGSNPPPPPALPPKPSANNLNNLNSRKNNVSGNSNAVPGGSPRRGVVWPGVSTRTSPAGSRPSSPRAHSESEGYNSADEQNPCLVSSYDDVEKERQFEVDIRRAKGYEVKRMLEDGNCLFRAVADQVYGDSELYDLVRQMCIDYMEQERDHYSQFITEGFTSYCKRKRRDTVYGNNVEIQAICEMYNRPVHIYSYSTEPINIFQRGYNTDTPPIRLSYHYGNHYNSLVDPRRSTVGAGLGFSSLRGINVDRDQVKAAIKAQQDQQIDNALLAEGRFYSDLELTEKEIEVAVMEASRAEYLGGGTLKQQAGYREPSTSNAEPSSSGARSSGSDPKKEKGKENENGVSSSSIQMLLSMGFSYVQAVEAYSIFGDDDVDSLIYYLLETASASDSDSDTPPTQRKGKAAQSSSQLHK